MRSKTCVKCRARTILKNKTYHEKHPEYHEMHKEIKKEHNKQHREKNADKVKEYDRAGYQIKAYCPHCNSEIGARKLNRHLQTQTCKKKPHPNDKYTIVDGNVYLKTELL